MTYQPKIKKGVISRPHRIIVYGPHGIGKSSLAASAPNPYVLDLDRGTGRLNVDRDDEIDSWPKLLEAVNAIATNDAFREYKTLVFDTLDRAEWLCWQYLCENNKFKGRPCPVKTIDEVGGEGNGHPGFGKGYLAAYEEFRKLFGILERQIWEGRGMNVIILAHAKLASQKNNIGADYEKFTLKVHDKVSGMFYEVADAVLFANYQIATQKDGVLDGKRYRAVSDGTRYLFTEDTPAYHAKNRYGLAPRIPLEWNDFAEGVARGNTPDLLIELIRDKALEMNDATFTSNVDGAIDRCGGDADKLVRLRGWVSAQISKRREKEEQEQERAAAAAAASEGQQAQN